MNKYDMEQDLKQEVQELKISIDILTKDIGQQFSTLNENLSINFEQISKQITNLSSQPSLSNETFETNLVNNHQDSLQKHQKNSKIPNEYYIDYSYIKDVCYLSWVENLRQYSKDMAECRQKDNIVNFCVSARKTLESAIEVFFEQEYKYLSAENKIFLDAYDRVRISYDGRQNTNYNLPQIYIQKSEFLIESEHLKKICGKYISWNEIEKIRKTSLPASVTIFLEIIQTNFRKNANLRDKYNTILYMNNLRSLDTHGSKLDLKSQLNKFGNPTKVLYYSNENFVIIQKVISWFVHDIYKRILKISNN